MCTESLGCETGSDTSGLDGVEVMPGRVVKFCGFDKNVLMGNV